MVKKLASDLAVPGASQQSPTSNTQELFAEITLLREQLALRDLALDGIPTTFVIADRTAAEPTVLYANRSAASMYGQRREDMIGQPIRTLAQFNLTTAPPDFQKDYATLALGEKIAFETESRRSDGLLFWRGVTIVPVFDSAGRLTCSIATSADITAKRESAMRQQQLQDQLVGELKERERIMSELQLAQKLESVGRLASGIAHEINTPIQYIGDCIHFLNSGFADIDQLLLNWKSSAAALPPGSTSDIFLAETEALCVRYELDFLRAEIPKAFERMSEGVQRVTNIVRSMKEFAHPDSTEQSAANINQAIASTLIVAAHVYKYVARVETDFGDLPDVICRVGELNQVFLNLIVNAAHAVEDAGRDVETGVIKICTRQADTHVIICIGDNGCGIPPENLSKLYDPFFTTKDVGRGTGQGLAMAHSIIVDKHDGELDVRSSVGAGTEFTVKLRIAGLNGSGA
jgi:two-component system, NtrC family, sensor kinase